jgi:hypothetical protein
VTRRASPESFGKNMKISRILLFLCISGCAAAPSESSFVGLYLEHSSTTGDHAHALRLLDNGTYVTRSLFRIDDGQILYTTFSVLGEIPMQMGSSGTWKVVGSQLVLKSYSSSQVVTPMGPGKPMNDRLDFQSRAVSVPITRKNGVWTIVWDGTEYLKEREYAGAKYDEPTGNWWLPRPAPPVSGRN